MTKRSSAPTTIDLQVSERIRAMRAQRGHTQSAVAEQLGIVAQQYHKYESGLNRVSAGMLINLAKILDCTVADIIPPDLRGHGKVDETVRLDMLRQELIELILDCDSEQNLVALRTLLVAAQRQ